MFSGSAPAQTTYQGNAGAGSLIGELALDLEAKFRTAHEAFLAADVDRSGALSIDELISVCRANQLPPDNVQAAMNTIDVDRNGMIDYSEFARHLMRTANPGQQQQLRSFPFAVTMPMHIKEGGTSTRNTLGGTLRRGRTPRVYSARKKSAVPRCHPRPLLRSPR